MLAALVTVLCTTVLSAFVFAVSYREARARGTFFEAVFDAAVPSGMLSLSGLCVAVTLTVI